METAGSGKKPGEGRPEPHPSGGKFTGMSYGLLCEEDDTVSGDPGSRSVVCGNLALHKRRRAYYGKRLGVSRIRGRRDAEI